VATVRDVGEQTTLEDQLRHQAFHDPLTALPNRSLFEDRVRHAVARTRRSGLGMAVLFVDLDDFKTVNDSLGHATGDELLRQVAKRLDECVRTADTVARLGGDEFAVLVEAARGPDDGEEVAVRIHAGLQPPFQIDGHELFIQASVGIALAESGSTTEELMRNADTAMYAAKATGKGRSEMFRATMHMEVRRRLQLSGDLRRAMLAGELSVQYQPLVDLSSGRVLGAEALARWTHPTLGSIPPSDFIPVAEETGLVVPLGGWVLTEACRQARAWQAQTGGEAIYVSVNVSPRQFRQPGKVVEQVREATASSGIDPSLLVLEITESVLMQDRDAVRDDLVHLQELGVRVAIDDFGTGYSALSYLRDFPIDMVKMDQSFVNDLSAGKGDQALVRSVVELGEALNMQIVAEGVERRDQLDHLSEMRCSIGQGYYFARPLDSSSMAELIGEQLAAADKPAV
jgi:diguanylate cyclase (GGDEF)-like protein